ncbi:MAG: prephenate dehydrogenase/arogenate dehydrogenase family protein [Nitrospirae bacterium]|nr:prephenate dehydrogenase/arogenate dehydrogenase family protein [Candidatus Troglogloeales bacterium]
MLFKQMTIIGVGFIGGSLALAAKRAGVVKTVVGYGKKRGDLHKAASMGAVDRYFLTLPKAVEGADLVVLATPVAAFEQIISAMAPYLKIGAVVTDVGSVKGELVYKMESLLSGRAFFVGGHPMAGSEKSGIQSAFPTLFGKALFILTPTSKTDKKAIEKVAALCKGIGAEVVKIDPIKHDQIMAVVSHLPHLVAYSLMELFFHPRLIKSDMLSFAAGGLRDFTRIAESAPNVWHDIFLLNKTAVVEAIDLYQETLEKMKKAILAAEKGDEDALFKILNNAKSVREKIRP